MSRCGEAHEVVRQALVAAREELGPNLRSAYTLGSLAHGGFAPLVSDVDLALIVVDPDIATRVDRVKAVVSSRTTSALADRLSVFWADVDGVHNGIGDVGRLPELDRLDLLESGVVLHGDDIRFGATPPVHDDLIVQAAEFALRKFDAAFRRALRAPTELVADGVRAVTKAVLFPVRFGYTLETGAIGRNDDAASWYTGRGREVVAAAMRWRVAGIRDESEAIVLLKRHLVALYVEFVDAYCLRLAAAGHQQVAAELAQWGEQLGSPGSG